MLWFAGYAVFLRHFVPRMRDLAKTSSELRSLVMGRVVDSYTNILTVKLFARARDEDNHVREAVDEHEAAITGHMTQVTWFVSSLVAWNLAPGFLLRQRSTMRSRAGGLRRSTVGRSAGSLSRMALMVSAALLPSKARCPASSPYRTVATAKISAR